MERQERIEHISEELQNTVIRLSREYDIKVAEMIGVLEIIKLNLFNEQLGVE